MRISSQTVSDNIISQLQKLNSKQATLQNEVSSGQRIFQPEDDPASVGRVLALKNEQQQLQQYNSNATRALQVSQATYSGIQSFKKLSDRVGEIAVLGAGVQGAESYSAYATEVDQLLEQGVQAGNATLGNDHLFAGTALNTTPFTVSRDIAGKITAVAYAGNSSTSSIALSSTASITPGTNGTTNQQLADFLNNLVSLRNALNAQNPTAVSTVQSGLTTSENNIVNTMSEQGAVQLRIQVAQEQQQTSFSDLTTLISKETDADMSTTVVQLNQTQTAYQAALQSAAKIMKISLLDYIQ